MTWHESYSIVFTILSIVIPTVAVILVAKRQTKRSQKSEYHEHVQGLFNSVFRNTLSSWNRNDDQCQLPSLFALNWSQFLHLPLGLLA